MSKITKEEILSQYPSSDYFFEYAELDSIQKNFVCKTTGYITINKLVKDKEGKLVRSKFGGPLFYAVAKFKRTSKDLYEETECLESKMWKYIHANNFTTDYYNVIVNNEEMKISKFYQLYKDKF